MTKQTTCLRGEGTSETRLNRSRTRPFLTLKGGILTLLEADLIAKQATLSWLTQRYPSWTHHELAAALGMSRSWVSKWLKRLRQAEPHDVMALHARSRARHTPPASIAFQPTVVQRILEIRTATPENLQRVPGPEPILYYLHRDASLKDARVGLPRSQAPIWKILRQAGCIEEGRRRKPKQRELRQPGEEVQFDLKDASSVPADLEGKRQHVVEVANFVDAGTLIERSIKQGLRGSLYPCQNATRCSFKASPPLQCSAPQRKRCFSPRKRYGETGESFADSGKKTSARVFSQHKALDEPGEISFCG